MLDELEPVRYDRFYRFDDLTSLLQRWAEQAPELYRVESIGRSYESRDIWLATVTNFATGRHEHKPALLVDANIHATEVTGCTAALHLIHHLLSAYGTDAKATRAVDTRSFYVLPRLNPDGAEVALADRPRYLRSSVRPYPRLDEQDGLHGEDVDGDGRVLTMRVADSNGAWKPAKEDPRLMVPRDPVETAEDGQFYRLLPEGTIRNYDGVMIKVAPPFHGLDLNRNFPMDWAAEGEQRGAGPYPTSEPEIRAMVQAVVERPNITGYIAYHTFSGVHLRPYSAYPDDHFPTPDLRVYQQIGEEATRITGYPAVSVFHDFKYDPKTAIKGTADDWMYDHLGVFAWTTEFWSPQRQAGIEDFHMIEWLRDHRVEDELAILQWSDEHIDGRGYVDWYPFDHPQLGPVQLGGWDLLKFWANVPFEFLEREVAPHSEFAVFHALISPRLEIKELRAEPLGGETFHVRLLLENTGWLPSYVAQHALDRKVVRPLEVELTLPEGARLATGEKRMEAGQLEGRVHKRSVLWWYEDDSTKERAKLEWVVEAPGGGRLGVEARHERAGTVQAEVELP